MMVVFSIMHMSYCNCLCINCASVFIPSTATVPVSVGISQETYEVLESDEEVAINISVIIGELRRNVSLRFIPEDGTAVGMLAT